jgi:hypothetical protein
LNFIAPVGSGSALDPGQVVISGYRGYVKKGDWSIGSMFQGAAPLAVNAASASSTLVVIADSVASFDFGDTYTALLVAMNARGTSAQSYAHVFTPTSAPVAMAPPVCSPGDGTASIAFNPPPTLKDRGGLPISTYRVTAYDSTDVGTVVAFADTASSPVTISGLPNGANYVFTVYASNSAGSAGQSSLSVSCLPASPPPVPINIVVSQGDSQLSVAFNGTVISGLANTYTLTSTDIPAIVATGAASPIFVPNLNNGQAYVFTLAASNSKGTGPSSSPTPSMSPIGTPIAPTICPTCITHSDSQVTISFTMIDNADVAKNGGSPITSYTATSAPGGITATGFSPLIVAGLSNGQAYTFTLTASNNMLTSAPSAVSAVSTPFGRPNPPSLSTITVASRTATVPFVPPAAIIGVTIVGYQARAIPSTGGVAVVIETEASPVVFTTLTSGVAYNVTVATRDNNQDLGRASAVSVFTPVGKPEPPTLSSAIVQLLANKASVDAQGNAPPLHVAFTAPTDAGGFAVQEYKITVVQTNTNGTSAQPITLGSYTATSSPFVFTVPRFGDLYEFSAVTVTQNPTAADTMSTASTSVSVRAFNYPAKPTISAVFPFNQAAEIEFAPYKDDGGAPVNLITVTATPKASGSRRRLLVGEIIQAFNTTLSSTATTRVTMSGLTNGQPYTCTVIASNRMGDSQVSPSSASITPVTVPDQPIVR